MDKTVGILLKVGASGLENIDQLAQSLKQAGVSTQDLDDRAKALAADMQLLGATSGSAVMQTNDMAKAQAEAVAEAERLVVEAKALEAAYQALNQQLQGSSAATDYVVAADGRRATALGQTATASRDAAAAALQESAAIETARQRMQAADSALESYRASLGDLTKAEKDEVAQLDLLTARSRDSRIAYLDQATNASAAARALDSNAQSAKAAAQASKDGTDAANSAASATRNQGAAADEASGKLGGMVGQLRNLTALDIAMKVGGELKGRRAA